MGVLSDKQDVKKVALGWHGEEKEPYGEEFIQVENFFENIVGAYNEGTAEIGLPVDIDISRSLVPAGTGALRDFSYIAPEIPLFASENCVGCMDCVTECPDTAILAKVVDVDVLEKTLAQIESPDERAAMRQNWAKTTKYHTQFEKKGQPGGLFGIFIDPTKCKGCAECVAACGEHQALQMIQKEDDTVPNYRQSINFFRRLPETPERFIQERVLADMMLAERSMLYVGGAGSCAGCGEASVLRMMLAATGFVYGPENIGIVASTGCNTV
jgi:pyruvate ferredoxin oxidoreductase beta subunit